MFIKPGNLQKVLKLKINIKLSKYIYLITGDYQNATIVIT